MQAATPPEGSDKRVWRRWLRQRLGELGDPARDAEAIRRHLAEFLADLPACRLAAFAAMPEEVDLRPLAAAPPHSWHFPRITGDRLSFHPVGGPGDLEGDAYGIDAPRPDIPACAIGNLDLFLVPGLGFGRDGSRLGRGRGFYDRALTLARPEVPRIAIAYDEQIVDAVPTDAHDVPVTHLLTPSGLRAIRP